MIEINDREFTVFQAFLLEKCGIIIPIEKRYLFNTRLNGLLSEGQYQSFTQLYTELQQPGRWDLACRIVEVMTTNETSFFRDTHPFTALSGVILPQLLAAKKTLPGFVPGLRIWSAGCSTGQEPYSIAMLLHDWLEKNPVIPPTAVQIFATDISAAVIRKAGEGLYSDAEINKGMREDFKTRYLQSAGNKWLVCEKIKKMITFHQLNLTGNFLPELRNLDLIFCRNVIIYFTDQLKQQILGRFAHALSPGGSLLLGAAENLYGFAGPFTAKHIGPTTIYKVNEYG